VRVESVGCGDAVSLLPADAKPPLDLNRETMEKFRPEMRKFYLNKAVQFR